MPQRFDIGPRGFQKASGVATFTFTPLLDRAATVTRLLITNVSANDVWVVNNGGREVGRYQIDTVGNQQLLGGTAANYPKNSDLFAFCKEALGLDFYYPVPQGLPLTISSVNGATANIAIAYEERDPGDINATLINHPQGTRFIMPIYLVPPTNATQTAGLAEYDFSGQVAAAWIPPFYGLTELPAGYAVRILGSFHEGAGRNTFSGSADHRSITDHIALDFNGMRYFTRSATDGIPNYGPAAAAGSANTVYGSVETPFPAFQLVEYVDWQPFDPPLVMRGGDQFRWRVGISGDSAGGADYSHAYTVLLADIQTRVA